jgi:hypothetical protein
MDDEEHSSNTDDKGLSCSACFLDRHRGTHLDWQWVGSKGCCPYTQRKF